MVEGIERFYQKLAESIQAAVPEEWNSAKMEAIFFSGSSVYFAEYTRKTDGAARSFAITRSGESALRGLRKQFKAAGKPAWGRVCFQMQSSGKFNIHFGYEDCDDNGDTFFDEEKELKRAEERHMRLTSG